MMDKLSDNHSQLSSMLTEVKEREEKEKEANNHLLNRKRVFGHLVIGLPSEQADDQGQGEDEVLVTYQDESQRRRYKKSSTMALQFQPSYASFRTEARCEVAAVKKGIRMCLVYDLVLIREEAYLDPPTPEVNKLVLLATEKLWEWMLDEKIDEKV